MLDIIDEAIDQSIGYLRRRKKEAFELAHGLPVKVIPRYRSTIGNMVLNECSDKRETRDTTRGRSNTLKPSGCP